MRATNGDQILLLASSQPERARVELIIAPKHMLVHVRACLCLILDLKACNAVSTMNVVKKPDIVTATGKKRVAMGGEDFHPQHTPVQKHRAIST